MKKTNRAWLPLPFLLILVGLLLIVSAGVGVAFQSQLRSLINQSQGDPTQSIRRVRKGASMQNFALVDINGKNVRLSDYPNRPVLINAWATWCPPCKAEMPDLNEFYKQNQADGFVILAINAGETREQAGQFARQLGLSFPVLLDPDEALMDQLSIHDFPTSILVGKDGVIQSVHIGMFLPGQLELEILPLIQ
jgi:peroxiredoxin